MSLLEDISFYPQEGIKAILEKVHAMPHDGRASLSKFMRRAGHLDMALIALNIPYSEVHPKVWQNRLSIALPKGDGKNKTLRKRMIKEWCQERHPHLKVINATADALAMLTVWMDGRL